MQLPALYLLRHAQTDWNAQHRLQGQTDVPLNEAGRAQALAAAPRVAQIPFAACFSSPLSRAHETARLALSLHPAALPIELDADLRERNFGRMNGKTDAEINADEAQNPHLYTLQGGRRAAVDGEPFDDFSQRVARSFSRYLTCLGPVLLVTHGGYIRQLVRSLVSPEAVFQPDNAGLYRFSQTAGGGWQIAALQAKGDDLP